MLNAVALNSILDVDEFLFASFAPISIQLGVRNLQPVRMSYSRRRRAASVSASKEAENGSETSFRTGFRPFSVAGARSQLESAFLFVLLLFTLLCSYLAFVEPLSRSMAEVKMERCARVFA